MKTPVSVSQTFSRKSVLARWAALGALVVLPACEAANETADTVARDTAKSVVNGVVEDKFPGVNAAPVTDCVIDNASRGQILSIAKASVTGVDQETVETVVGIAKKPDTVKCITNAGFGLLK